MKTIKKLAALVALAITLPLQTQITQAAPMGSTFTYQGRLNFSGSPAINGLYDFSFTLHDAATVGSPVGSAVALSAVPVTNGLFTVPLDFGAPAFTSGEARWLQLQVATNGLTPLVTLNPRQRLTPTPQAIYAGSATTAATASSAGNLTGPLPASQLTGTIPDARLSSNVALRAGGNVFTGNQTIAADVSVGGRQNFGQQTRQMLNLWSTNYGIGVQSLTTYFRTDSADGGGGFAWYQGGMHSDANQDPGAGGQKLMSLDSSGLNVSNVKLAVNPNGGIEVGPTTAPFAVPFIDFHHGVNAEQDFNVRLINDADHQLKLQGNFAATGSVVVDQDGLNNGDVFSAGLTFGTSSGEGIASRRTPGDNRFGLDFYTGGLKRMSMLNNNGFVGIGTTAPSEKLHVVGNILASGNASVCALTIRGGCDLAEPFQMSGKDLPTGAVVVIDESNPGHLKLSESAYDTRVAGIISGANGVNPGISLHQEGVMEGGQNVALSGRVYVQADATNGAIKPGDLLTTSATPGHAMKVAEPGKAQGAILGKAMTSLKEGQGMVLVLVSLQ